MTQAPFRPPSDPTWSPASATARPRPRTMAVLVGVTTGVVLAATIAWLAAGDTSYRAGQAFGAAVVPMVAVTLLVGLTQHLRWRLWHVALLVIAAECAVVAVTQLPQLAREHRDASAPVSVLSSPEVVGRWHRVDSPAARSLVRGAVSQLSSATPGTIGVGGEYRTAAGTTLVFIGLNAVPGNDRLGRGQDETLRGFAHGAHLEGAHDVSQGALGGRMTCGRLQDRVLCAWIDRGVFATIALAGHDVGDTTAEAAIRAFRALVETTP